MMTLKRQYWVNRLILLIIIMLGYGWWYSLNTVSEEIHIAAGMKGGQYYKLLSYLKPYIEQHSGSKVIIYETEGTVENDRLLSENKVDFAIYQLGPTGINDKLLITPLYSEVVQIIVRKDSNINRIDDFIGHAVAINSAGSGMRATAEQLLRHYGVKPGSINAVDMGFKDLEKQRFLDAAMVTSGIMNSDVEKLLLTGNYKFIPISEAQGIAKRQAFFDLYTIPKGLYQAGEHAIPRQPIETISTMAVLVANQGVAKKHIQAFLHALYQSKALYQFPDLLSKEQAYHWQVLPKYSVAAAYFNPYEGIDLLASMMESLAAGKELLFALGAAFYVLWDWRNRRRLLKVKNQLSIEKERLDHFLQQTIEIERRLLSENSLPVLKQQLVDVTKIKLAALEVFTHEDLRADQAFSIFLTQCANLITKIQIKINLLALERDIQEPMRD